MADQIHFDDGDLPDYYAIRLASDSLMADYLSEYGNPFQALQELAFMGMMATTFIEREGLQAEFAEYSSELAMDKEMVENELEDDDEER